jgi:hypothetical protein
LRVGSWITIAVYGVDCFPIVSQVRHRPNTAVVVDKTPVRADERSLQKGTSIERESAWVDEKRAASFNPEKVREAEHRIGVNTATR